ncbi:MAG: site-specific DNA-methyltransferase [Chthoniobacteraceae bacterium]
MGTLYYGDNLDILTRYIADESVDLVYLDPPFNSAQNYNAFFQEKDGTAAAAQIQAFKDTWEWNHESRAAYDDLSLRTDKLGGVMRAFMEILGPSDMMAYLAMMAPRLVALRRALKSSGSLYLHCDPTASHYLKLLLDAVFGAEMFRSEIVWKRTTTHNDSKRWSDNTDTIFFYSKADTFTWNPPFDQYGEDYIADKYRHDDGDGRGAYRLDNMTSPNPRPNMMYEWKGHAWPEKGWRYSKETMAELDADGRIWYPDSKEKRPQLKRYLSEGKGPVMGNLWQDIPPLNSQAKERLGYPTQKPVALLERIILASSNPGDMVLDPFCGCGTTVDAAQKHGRAWSGIDITHLAITLIKGRLRDTYGADVPMKVVGEPTDLAGARLLAAENKYQFQWWALGLVGARPVEEKKGADGGVDGKILFRDHPHPKEKPQSIIFSVKGGHLKLDDVRALDSVVTKNAASACSSPSRNPPNPCANGRRTPAAT